MSLMKLSAAARGLIGCAAALLAFSMIAPTAHAAFHLWSISEVYTNNTGTLQFVELTDSFGGQNFVNGNQIHSINIGNTQTNTFTVPGVSLPGNTFGHSLLFGTAGIQAAGGPAPDYIIPNGFLFAAGGTLNFFGLNSGPYTALPTDGILSRTWGGGNAVNSPTNYAGQTGTVPGPVTFAVVTAAGALSLGSRRRRTQ